MSSRREFLSRSALALSAALLGRSVRLEALQGGGPSAPVTPVFTPIRRNVGFFTGRGGTIGYLATNEGVAVVDSQFPDTAALCLEGLRERSGGRHVDVLINTHHHGDHTGGNIAFREATRRVVAHVTAAAHMKAPPGRPAPEGENYYPTEFFMDRWATAVADEVIRAAHYGRAHTSGDIVVLFERANVVHMGDLVFNRRHPVVDRPAGASLAGWIEVLERVTATYDADTVYIFGHAGEKHPVTGSRDDLGVMRDYLTALLEHVRAAQKAGRSREEALAVTSPLAGFPDHGPLNPTILGAAWDELAAG
ncbi:MAG: MBL fold metallo-hydrolase [Acidobacteriota bacterium]|jgi:cyclase|nr:MAG: MBL fold metallo-hydrolase [Acidobacteriota bacterium]